MYEEVSDGDVVQTRDSMGITNTSLKGVLTQDPDDVTRFVLWHVPSHRRYLAKHQFTPEDSEYLSGWVTRVDEDTQSDILKGMAGVPLSPRASDNDIATYDLYIAPLLAKL